MCRQETGPGVCGSDLGGIGIFDAKELSMRGICFRNPSQVSEIKSTGFRAARPSTAPPRNTVGSQRVAG
jgi:hypothetical protein